MKRTHPGGPRATWMNPRQTTKTPSKEIKPRSKARKPRFSTAIHSQQLIDVSPLEMLVGAGFELLLSGVRQFLDRHDKPFKNATPTSGQTHTFKSPTARL